MAFHFLSIVEEFQSCSGFEFCYQENRPLQDVLSPCLANWKLDILVKTKSTTDALIIERCPIGRPKVVWNPWGDADPTMQWETMWEHEGWDEEVPMLCCDFGFKGLQFSVSVYVYNNCVTIIIVGTAHEHWWYLFLNPQLGPLVLTITGYYVGWVVAFGLLNMDLQK